MVAKQLAYGLLGFLEFLFSCFVAGVLFQADITLVAVLAACLAKVCQQLSGTTDVIFLCIVQDSFYSPYVLLASLFPYFLWYENLLAINPVSCVCDIRSLAPWHELDDMACCEVLENDIYLFCAGIS